MNGRPAELKLLASSHYRAAMVVGYFFLDRKAYPPIFVSERFLSVLYLSFVGDSRPGVTLTACKTVTLKKNLGKFY